LLLFSLGFFPAGRGFGKTRRFRRKFDIIKLIYGYKDRKIIGKLISDDVFRGTEIFLQKINPFVTLKKKLLKYTPVAGKFMKKADTDVEITLDVVRNIDNLNVVVIVSGDSDFLELKNYVVHDKKKNILFVGYEENMAWELRQCWHLYVNRIKNEVAFQ